MKNRKQIAQLAQMACILEACAPKPGNVNRAHDFADTTLEDFLFSAVAIGPVFENGDRMGIGEMVWHATAETRRRVQTNTNLGLILLLAPLVKACNTILENPTAASFLTLNSKNIRRSLSETLHSLTMEDARHAYRAIRHARPGGLGKVSSADVADEPAVTLLQAMELAQDRDAVAREYVTDYAITFDIGLPALTEALCHDEDFSKAVVQTFLAILKHVPDTLIARKRGFDIARQVSQQAGKVLAKGGIYTLHGQSALAEMDQSLRDETHTLNPGTTADLAAAAIFLALIEK